MGAPLGRHATPRREAASRPAERPLSWPAPSLLLCTPCLTAVHGGSPAPQATGSPAQRVDADPEGLRELVLGQTCEASQCDDILPPRELSTRRPHFPPTEQLAILEIRAARAC